MSTSKLLVSITLIALNNFSEHIRDTNFIWNKLLLGVPYIPRKMMAMTSPRLEIQKNEDDMWTIRTITLMRTVELIFKMGEEFEETMPSNVVLKVI